MTKATRQRQKEIEFTRSMISSKGLAVVEVYTVPHLHFMVQSVPHLKIHKDVWKR